MTGNHHLVPGEHAGRPRVVFAAFRSVDSPMLQAWGRFREPLIAAVRAEREQPQPESRQVARQQPQPESREVARQQPQPESREVARQHPLPTPAAASGLWRLLATNNRELGRSCLLYTSLSQARAHVQQLQEPGVELEVTIVGGPANLSRGWVVLHEGSPVMTCGRWYPSTSAVAASVGGALAALPHAVLSEEADHTAPSGRFSRRDPSKNHALQW